MYSCYCFILNFVRVHKDDKEDMEMGFTEILTIIFIVLKLLGVITWAWWVCLLPEIIIVVVAQLVAIYKTHKSIKKHFDEF